LPIISPRPHIHLVECVDHLCSNRQPAYSLDHPPNQNSTYSELATYLRRIDYFPLIPGHDSTWKNTQSIELREIGDDRFSKAFAYVVKVSAVACVFKGQNCNRINKFLPRPIARRVAIQNSGHGDQQPVTLLGDSLDDC